MRKRLLQVVRDGFEDARGAHRQDAGQNEEIPPGLVPKDAGTCLRKNLGERIDLEQVDMEQSVLLGNPFDGLDLGHRGFGGDASAPGVEGSRAQSDSQAPQKERPPPSAFWI